MTKYERYVQLRNSMNLKDADVSRETKIAKSTFSDWKNGRSEPKNDKLQKISDFFGVKIDFFLDNNADYDKFTDIPINNTAKKIALNIQCNMSLRMLYDIVKDSSPEELQTFIRIIEAFKKTPNS